MAKKKKTIAKLKKEARHWFQRWIRLTKGPALCVYGCGKYLDDIRMYDACHYLKAELYPEGIFDVNNVYPGCKGCNIRDPLIAYRQELVKRVGEPKVKLLEHKYQVNRNGSFKWDRFFLEDTITKYKQLCKELERFS